MSYNIKTRFHPFYVSLTGIGEISYRLTTVRSGNEGDDNKPVLSDPDRTLNIL